jgi:predicted RNase H-like nuclease (RuvC/YqgF family)
VVWDLAADLNDVGPDSPGEIARKLARLEELEPVARRLEIENVGLHSEVEDLRSENAGLREALDRMGQPALPPADGGLDITASLRRAAPAPATERGSG